MSGFIMAKTITIYTTNTCAYCVQVKKWLGSKGLTWTEVNLDQNPERFDEILQLTGQAAVPVTVVSDSEDADGMKDVTVGWNPAKLGSAIADMIPQAA